jgi:ribosomal protein S17E
MSRYKDYVQKMFSENKEVLDEFKTIHDEYSLNPEKWQATLNERGAKILEIINEYENRLCKNTERGRYIKYSSTLAEKFHNEVRKAFPMIDYVGIRVVTNKIQKKPDFQIKKIKL